MEMFCVNCGSPMKDGEMFCIRCGMKQIPNNGINPGMSGRPVSPYGNPGMPNQPMSPYGAPGMANQPMSPYGAPGMPNQPMSPYGAPGMVNQPMSPYGAPGMVNQPMSPYGNPGMPAQNAPMQPMPQQAPQQPVQATAQTAAAQPVQQTAPAQPVAQPTQTPAQAAPAAQPAPAQPTPQQPVQATAQTAAAQPVQQTAPAQPVAQPTQTPAQAAPAAQSTLAQAAQPIQQTAPAQPEQPPFAQSASEEPTQVLSNNAAARQSVPPTVGITQTADIFNVNAKTAQGVPPTEVTPKSVLEEEKPKKKFPWWIIAIAVGVLIIGGAAGVFFFFRSQKVKEEKAEEERLEAIQQLFDNADDFYESKKYEQAISEYKDVLNEELTDDDIERAYLGIAKSYVGMANEASNNGDYDVALGYYKDAENALSQVKEWSTYKKKMESCEKDIEKGRKNAESGKESKTIVTSEPAPIPSTVVDRYSLQDTGDTLTIYVWNDEWKNFFWKYMPGAVYDYLDDAYRYSDTGKLGDLDVVFKVVPSTDGAYQDSLDKAIRNGEDVDIFLVEADYAQKYTVDGIALPMKEIGITDADMADQYAYTQQVVTNGGVIYGSSWQTCISGMIYNRAIAKQVLGTDDPASIQAMVSDWDKYEEVAGKMKNAGYKMTPRASTTYRVFANNMSTPWIVNGSINLDDNVKKWVDMSKRMVDAGQTNTGDLWNTGDAFYSNTTFCVFGPAWYFDYCMGYDDYDQVDSIADKGGWAFCEGPQAHFWGGTWLCVGAQSDNLRTCSDIIYTMTLDKDILKKLVENENQNPNSKELMYQYGNDATMGNMVLGGQNYYSVLASAGSKIDVSTMTEKDMVLNDQFQLAMDKYFSGQLSYDDAYAEFEKKAKELIPTLN